MKNNQSVSRLYRRPLALVCLLLLTAAFGVVTWTVTANSPGTTSGKGKGLLIRTTVHDPEIPNYDIRTEKNEAIYDFMTAARTRAALDAAQVADIRDGFVRGEESIKARIPLVKIEYNSDIRIPEVISPDVWAADIEFLTAPSNQKRSDLLRSFVKQNNELVGMSGAQIDMLDVTADYTNPDGNISYAHLEQRINNVPVFRGELKAGFTRDGRIIRVINNLAPGLNYDLLSTDFGDPTAAVRAAALQIKHELRAEDVTQNTDESTELKAVFGTGDWATTAEKMYFPTEPGVAVPAWRVLIWQPVSAYYVIVDAQTGTMLWRKNLGNDQTQTATYQVYRNATGYIDAADNPAPLSPGPLVPTNNTQGAIVSRANVILIGNEGNPFNDLGWITDGAHVTDGNHVEAGVDRSAPDGVDATQVGSPSRVFTSTWNPPPRPEALLRVTIR